MKHLPYRPKDSSFQPEIILVSCFLGYLSKRIKQFADTVFSRDVL